jgi:phospholipase C
MSSEASRRAERRSARRTLQRRAGPRFGPPDASLPIGKDTLPHIKHIVVLMMENHSYDSYLGMLGRGDGFELGSDGLPTASNKNGDGVEVRASPRGDTSQECGLPTQSWHASHGQYARGKNDGFVTTAESLAEYLDGRPDTTVGMQFWTKKEVPFYYGLAGTFPLLDRWFASCLGPTFPNRRFLLAGTAHGLIDNLPTGLLDYPPAGTIFDLLTAHGIDWRNYHHQTRFSWFRDRAVRVLGRPGIQVARAAGLLAAQIPGLDKYLSGAGGLRPYMMGRIQYTANVYPLGWRAARNHLRPLDQFFRDAEDGTLPPFAIVDPDFGEFSEENPQDISDGEAFAASVVRAVMRGKGWPNTLLIWTYDEHGGYFDHVPPPKVVAPDDVKGHSLLNVLGAMDWLLRRFRLWRKLKEANSDRIGNRLEPRTYDRLGFRVPAVVVSPFARRDYVSSRDGPLQGTDEDGSPLLWYDHTSILRTLERKWNLPPLTMRDANARDLLDALDLEASPFLQPPDLPDPIAWGSAHG